MTRWSDDFQAHVESPRADAFLADLLAVYEKHGLSLGHEDGHGAFIVEDNDDYNRYWVSCAHLARGVTP